MKEEIQLKTMMWLFIVVGIICWFTGFFVDEWMIAVSGLGLLIGAMGAYTNIRIRRIEKKLGTGENTKKH
jgi:hypothetical protein